MTLRHRYSLAVRGSLKVGVIIVVLSVILGLPIVVLSPLGAPTAGSLIGLGGLAIAFVARATNPRVSIYAALGLGLGSLLVVNAAAHPALGVLGMMAIAAGQGITARWTWNHFFILIPITLSFIASESVLSPPAVSAIVFAAITTGYALVVALAVSWVSRHSTDEEDETPTPLSWSRTAAYAGLLVVATAVTSTIALTNEWGHTGGWLIMTPFIVIQPYVQDGWRKAFNRAFGTIAGMAVAYALATLVGQGAALAAVGYAFGVLAIIAAVKQWHYAIYTTLLTPAVVILESAGRPIEETGDHRIVATLIGVGVSLVAMAVAIPIYRRGAARAELDHY